MFGFREVSYREVERNLDSTQKISNSGSGFDPDKKVEKRPFDPDELVSRRPGFDPDKFLANIINSKNNSGSGFDPDKRYVPKFDPDKKVEKKSEFDPDKRYVPKNLG